MDLKLVGMRRLRAGYADLLWLQIAAAHDATPAQVAIAWLLGRQRRPPIVPLVAARTEAQLDENLRAVELMLDDAERERLDAAGAPELGFPRSLLESDHVRGLIYGETWSQLQYT